MRRKIIHEGASELTYEIREIVKVAREFQDIGKEIFWENIGDPIQKGEKISPWIKDIVANKAMDSSSYGYTDSQGDIETRRFIAKEVNSRGHVKIDHDDIVFFNGLGDAINKVYSLLKRESRVIGPSPAYSTHSSAEAAHSGYAHLTYNLDPNNGWLPDIQDLENKVKFNDSIAGIIIINPDNPTGAVYPKHILESIVKIAKEHDLFIICDETYSSVTFPDSGWTFLSSVIKDVPGISMRSLSKEVPWPGSRCGWIEVYNKNCDKEFSSYIDSIINAKRLEVCSTTLPQLVLPQILGDERYNSHLENRSLMLSNRADEISSYLNKIDGISAVKPKGGTYMTILFDKIPNSGNMEVKNRDIAKILEDKIKGVAPDKRFAYYLLASKGVCVVPLSGFYSSLMGFRITLLENDDKKRGVILKLLKDGIEEYLNS